MHDTTVTIKWCNFIKVEKKYMPE